MTMRGGKNEWNNKYNKKGVEEDLQVLKRDK
jgi:hypothetical protein